jgi:hypothetical protein
MSKPRSAVFIAKVPKSFKPGHVHSLPDEIIGGKFMAQRLSLPEAVRMAQAFNRQHMPSNGNYRHKWAIVLAGLDKSYFLTTQPAGTKSGKAFVEFNADQLAGDVRAEGGADHE